MINYNETKKLINLLKYITKHNSNVFSFPEDVCDIFSHGRYYHFERPDIVIEHKNIIFAIEHFEFNATRNLLKNNISIGNELMIQNDKFNRKYLCNSKIDEQFEVIEKIEVEATYDNYKKNFIDAFQKHINKINEYLENLKTYIKSNKKIKFGFWAEDTYPYGTYIKTNKELIPIIPIMDKDVFSFCKQNSNIDFFLFSNHDPDNNPIIFFEKNDLSSKKILEINKENFFVYPIYNCVQTVEIKPK